MQIPLLSQERASRTSSCVVFHGITSIGVTCSSARSLTTQSIDEASRSVHHPNSCCRVNVYLMGTKSKSNHYTHHHWVSVLGGASRMSRGHCIFAVQSGSGWLEKHFLICLRKMLCGRAGNIYLRDRKISKEKTEMPTISNMRVQQSGGKFHYFRSGTHRQTKISQIWCSVSGK